MKYTLTTLALLATAAVSMGTTLDLTAIPVDQPVVFAGSGDTIKLNGMSITAKDGVIALSDGTEISFSGPGGKTQLFHTQESTVGTSRGILVGATIDVGTITGVATGTPAASVTIAQEKKANLANMDLFFTGTLNTVVETTDKSLDGTTVLVKHTLLQSSTAIWNHNGNLSSYGEGGGVSSSTHFNFGDSDLFVASTNTGHGGLGLTIDATYDVGTYQIFNEGDNNVSIAYVAKYKHVPEPATATLSLLALAGLAARRRRK